jgi:hypothetical protein
VHHPHLFALLQLQAQPDRYTDYKHQHPQDAGNPFECTFHLGFSS